MNSRINALFSKFLNLLYPPRCMVCRNVLEVEGNPWVCDRCEPLIEVIQEPICRKCGAPIENEEERYCMACKLDFSALKIERNYSFMVYDDIAKDLIHGFKYSGYKDYGEGLITVMAQKMGFGFVSDADMLIPVPLHRKRLVERGFNQAEVLAYHISRQTAVPTVTDVLIRNRETAKQSLLGRKARTSNISGAFSVVNAEKIKDKRILLIDDIYTSGSTISECAGVLLSAGAKNVCSFTVCKAMRKESGDDL